jgi:hypothetical protein
LKLLLGIGVVPALFFSSVTRKLTTVRHSGLDSQPWQNPAIENKPDNDETNQKKPIHKIFSFVLPARRLTTRAETMFGPL